MKRLILTLSFLALASSAFAQAPNIVKYDQQIFMPGVDPVAGQPTRTNTYQATAAVCNQPTPITPPTVVNPKQISFDDLAVPGKSCIVQLIPVLLPALPNQAGYLTTLVQTDNAGLVSDRSAASNPFEFRGKPAVLTNVRVQ